MILAAAVSMLRLERRLPEGARLTPRPGREVGLGREKGPGREVRPGREGG